MKEITGLKTLKNGKFYDYPISREFINSLPKKTSDKINDELAKVNPDDLSKANNYYEYTKALAGILYKSFFFTKYPENYGAYLLKSLMRIGHQREFRLLRKDVHFTKISGVLLAMRAAEVF